MKVGIKSLSNGYNNFNFAPESMASVDFGRFQPVMFFDTIKGAKYNSVEGRAIVRLAPQVFPAFGRLSMRHATFHVPLESIVPYSTAFLANQPTDCGIPSGTKPSVISHFLNGLFAAHYTTASGITASEVLCSSRSNQLTVAELRNAVKNRLYDFYFINEWPTTTWPTSLSDTTNTYIRGYKMNQRGKRVFSLFKGAGYDFQDMALPFFYTSLNSYFDYNSTYIDAMPMLAYLKVYCDFFLSGVEYNTSPLTALLSDIYMDKNHKSAYSTQVLYDSSTRRIGFQNDWMKYINLLRVPFAQNMYTSAWNSTNSPLSSVMNAITQIGSSNNSFISPITDSGTNSNYGNSASIGNDANHVIHASTVSNSAVNFTAKGHEWLMAVQRYITTKNLAGSNVAKQFYAMFGISTNQLEHRTATKLEEGSERIMFNAIQSQSDTASYDSSGNITSGKPLGAYAGNAVSGMNIKYSYTCGSYGFMMTLCWLDIDPILGRGMHPCVLRTSPLDFANPAFDGKAFRPIPHLELSGGTTIMNQLASSASAALHPTTIVGYTNIYDDYRQMRDNISGVFSFGATRNWAFQRDLVSLLENENQGVYKLQDAKFKYYNPFVADSSITNPFVVGSGEEDRFYINIDWNVNASLPVLSPSGAFGLGEGDKVIAKNGDQNV